MKREALRLKICGILIDNGEMTAREIAKILYDEGIVYSPFREAVAPRLTELVRCGLVKEVGRKFDDFTKKEVKIYDVAVE